MRIYQITPLGKRLARTTNNPDTPNWRILHYLDHPGYATSDQISLGTGLDENTALGSLSLLKRKGLVEVR